MPSLKILIRSIQTELEIIETEAYRYLCRYGALALCDKHYGIMHTLSFEENLQTLRDYCHRKGGTL